MLDDYTMAVVTRWVCVCSSVGNMLDTLEHWKVAGFGGLASKRGWNKQRVKQFVSIRWVYKYLFINYFISG